MTQIWTGFSPYQTSCGCFNHEILRPYIGTQVALRYAENFSKIVGSRAIWFQFFCQKLIYVSKHLARMTDSRFGITEML